MHPARHPTQTKFCSDPNCISPARGLLKKRQSYQSNNRSTGCPNQAKNNVTSRVRLDEKYVARRALRMLVNPKPQFARVCVVFLQRDAQLESSYPVHTLTEQPTLRCAREPNNQPNRNVRKTNDAPDAYADQVAKKKHSPPKHIKSITF